MSSITRRDFLKRGAALSAGLSIAPYVSTGKIGITNPMKRSFGRIPFEVTSLGLGGQASIQWTPDDVDPAAIVVKAYNAGVNYFDTSNVYGPSQLNFGRAFRELGLVPGLPGYDESKRKSIFLTSKSGLRLCKGTPENGVMRGWTNGPRSSITIVDDVKRSLSQIFGDGKGAYPKGAYLDMVLIHALKSVEQIDYLYTGLDGTSPDMEVIGALAGLRDLRDGTNLTGINPKEEKLIKHVGFSGHLSPSVMMEMIRRDEENLLEGMLIAINANDRIYNNFQYNTIPVAKAKDMGIIAMKVFSDGTMYGKGNHFSKDSSHVIRKVGTPDLPSRRLVEYSLSVPGISTAIIGTGQVSDDAKQCQLTQNLSAAQIRPEGLTENQRREIGKMTAKVRHGETNYFQEEYEGLGRVANLKSKAVSDGVKITWDTAIAGDEPIAKYQVCRGHQVLGEIVHKPQTSMKPFEFVVSKPTEGSIPISVKTVDVAGRSTELQVA